MPKHTKKRVRYSHAIAKKILLLIESKKTIARICEMPNMPEKRSIWRWRQEHEDFNEAFRRSEDIRLSGLVDEMIDLTEEDVIKYLKDKGTVPDKGAVFAETQRRRLRVDTIKFLAARLYGTHSREPEETKVSTVVNVVNYKPETEVKEVGLAPKKVIDLQPAHLKSRTILTVAQQAQVDSLKPK